MSIKWNWKTSMEAFFHYLSMTIGLTVDNFKEIKSQRIQNKKNLTIESLSRLVKIKRISRGDRVSIIGKYSEYLPILSTSLIFPSKGPLHPVDLNSTTFDLPLFESQCFTLPIRLNKFKDMYLACLYSPKANSVYKKTLPLLYDSDQLFGKQKNASGKLVIVTGHIISLPHRWDKLFCDGKLLKFDSDDQNRDYTGLLVNSIDIIENSNVFLIDIWRLDHFRLDDYEDDSFEFYSLKCENKYWPNVSMGLMNYLSLLQFPGQTGKIIMTFGIVPRINIVNPTELEKARTILKTYYDFTYKNAHSSKSIISTFTVGHGIVKQSKFKTSSLIYQYDQCDPILEQVLDFK